MKHTIILWILLVYFLACNTLQEEKARFDFHELNLTAYNYVLTPEADDRSFYVAFYCSIDSNGNCLIARKDTFGKRETYFKHKLPTRFDTLFNRINFNELCSTYFTRGEIKYCIVDLNTV